MTEQHENRRVRMTKRLIKDALMELLEDHELANITVKAICETADVHRSTFYNYYSDPADLLSEIEQDFLDQIPNPTDLDKQDPKKLLSANVAFFDFVKENAKAFRILFRRSSAGGFTARMVDYLCSGFIPVNKDINDISVRYIQLYIANGTVGMLREWIDTDFTVSSRRIAEMMYSLSTKIFS